MSQLNPNIILGVQRPKTINPMELYQAKASIEQNELANRLSGMKVEEYERGIKETNALADVYRTSVGADGKLDRNKLFSGAAGAGLGAKIPGLQKEFAAQDKDAADMDSKRLETATKRLDTMGQALGWLKDNPSPENAQQVLSYLASNGVMNEQQLSTALQRVQANPTPQGISQFAMLGFQASLKAKDQLPTFQTRNTGGTTDTLSINPVTQKVTVANSVRNTQSPDSVASTAVQMRGQNMVDARSRDANSAGGKAPPGYRFKQDGSLEAIPGGPADIKAGEAGAKREQMQQGSLAQADRIIAKVDQALEKVGMNSAGMGGSLMAKIPGTDATNLRTDLDTIKANLGFAELQAMRQASPTGGALGAIAVQELVALQSTVASLDQAQTPEQLKARLGEVRKHYSNWKEAVVQSGKPQAGGATGDFSKPAAPAAALPSGWKVQAR